MTDRLVGLLRMQGIGCEGIHGDIQQSVRERTLKRFREGQMQVLVATDVAARGLDIDEVDAVVNFDMPDQNEDYVHRIGRTGRAKRHGVAFALTCSITDEIRLDEIRKQTGNTVKAMVLDADGKLTEKAEKK